MNVLFLTIGQIPDLHTPSVHIDLIRELRKSGHEVSVLCTREKRLGLPTELSEEDGVKILRLRIGNLTKCSMIEKGINTVLIEGQFKRAIRKYFGADRYDLVIYNTPPITLAGAVKYAKRKFRCRSYLILKDIFPQNAVDIGIMSTSGISGLLYKLFRRKEIQLYSASDRIGCMSRANKEYLLRYNPYLKEKNVEIFPNAVFSDTLSHRRKKDRSLLEKYGIAADRPVFIYGGNLGKPQGLEFFAEALKGISDKIDCSFVIAGSGTEKEKFFKAVNGLKNVYPINYLPYEEYENLCASCDVGLVMLDYRFTIPNYPSRILSYMENAMPVLACTDPNTDVKELVEEEAVCGKWCPSNDVDAFAESVRWFAENTDKFTELGENGRKYFEENFVADKNIEKLEKFINERRA